MRKILSIIFFLSAFVAVYGQKQLKVYQKNGEVERIAISAGSTIAHSRLDLKGGQSNDFITIQVTSGNDTRRYLISEIDSLVLPNGRRVVFHGVTVAAPVMAKTVRDVNGWPELSDLPEWAEQAEAFSATATGTGVSSPHKTSFSGNFPGYQGTNNVTFYWTENDRIRLDVGYTSRAENLSANNTSADFVFDGADDLEASAYTVYFPDKGITISSEQTQVEPDNTDHIGPSGDCGVAEATRQPDGTYSFTLNHKAAYLCFLPHINNLPSVKLTKIVLTCAEDIAGDYQMASAGLYSPTNTSNVITLNLENQDQSKGFFVGHSLSTVQDSCAAYMVVRPQTSSRNFTAFYYLTDTLSHIEKIHIQRFSFKPEENTVYPINCIIRDSEFRSIDLGLSVNWSNVNASADDPSKYGVFFGTDAEAEVALLEETGVTQWVMPTDKQKQELLTKCTWTRGVYNGQQGWLVAGKVASQEYGKPLRIFIPAEAGVSAEQSLATNYRRPVEALMIDLGLPSGTKWASRNIGAGSPEVYGDYYAWGETEPKAHYTRDTYLYYQSRYVSLGNDYDISGTQYDVATVKWGGLWQMPTKTDYEELINTNNCTWNLLRLNGVTGYHVKSKQNGNSIFLPFSGHVKDMAFAYTGSATNNNGGAAYATSNQVSSNSAYAYTAMWHNSWDSRKPSIISNDSRMDAYRYYGRAVRAVAKATAESDGQMFDARTLSPAWTLGDSKATLNGYLSSNTPIESPVTVGFVIGDDADVTMESRRDYREQTLSRAGSFTADAELYDNIGYWYRAYVQIDGVYYYGEPFHYGLEMVDLGLPSGILWANMNVGASTTSECGGYYSWGETHTKDSYADKKEDYQYYRQNIGTDRNITGTEWDAAHVVMGNAWRMPTKDEMQELVGNTTWVQTTQDNQTGYVVTGPNGKTIFLPAAGNINGTTHSNFNVTVDYPSAISKDNTYAYTLQCNPSYNSNKPAIINGSTWNDGRCDANRAFGTAIRAVATPNAVVADSVLNVLTDSVTWKFNDQKATLHGTLSSVRSLNSSLTVGFLIGESEALTEANALADHPQVVSTTGTFAQEVDVHDNMGYYYRAYVKIGGQYYLGAVRHYGVELVDLGLPSGTLWANMNVGASTPLEKGEFYAWGETEPAANDNYSQANYKYYQSGYVEIGNGPDGTITISGTDDDAATANWGKLWATPTRQQCQELIDGCTTTEVTVDGVTVWKYTSKTNPDRFIYLPKTGYMYGASLLSDGYSYYMTSTRNSSSNYYYFYTTSTSSRNTSNTLNKYYGTIVRPVAHPVTATANQRVMTVVTDAPEWTFGSATATVHGTLKSTTPLGADVSVGFLVGDSETMEQGDVGVTEQTAVLNADGTFSKVMTVTGNLGQWYRAYVKVGGEYYLGAGRHYAVEKVDLGLSTHTLWANMNVGSNVPEQGGDYFAWGNTTTSDSYVAANNPTYNTNIGDNITGNSTYDAARANWQGDWRMPTKAEFEELNTYCTLAKVMVNGQWCLKVTSKAEGNNRYIYLPLSGYKSGTSLNALGSSVYLWTSTVYSKNNTNAYHAYYPSSSTISTSNTTYRYFGMPVRPVISQ